MKQGPALGFVPCPFCGHDIEPTETDAVEQKMEVTGARCPVCDIMFDEEREKP